MNEKRRPLLEKRPDSASPESRIKEVIRTIQEVEKAVEKLGSGKEKRVQDRTRFGPAQQDIPWVGFSN